MASPALRLRPLGVGDLFDETIRLYRRFFLLFLGIVAVVTVPTFIVAAVVGFVAGSLSDEGSVLVLLALAVLFLPFVLAYLVMFAAMLQAVSDAYLGQRITFAAAYSRGLRCLLSMLGLTMLLLVVTTVVLVPLLLAGGAVSLLLSSDNSARTVLVLLAAILFLGTVVGGTYLGVMWGFTYHALVLEGRGIVAALGRSRQLVRGHWWRVFGITLLFLIFESVIGGFFRLVSMIFLSVGMVGGPTGIAAGALFGVVIEMTSQLLLAPIIYVGWTLLYYDLRVRKEGFDLELLAREVEAAA